MLYDIMPPLVFFASLAGVIAIIARAQVRLSRQQHNQVIRAHLNAVASAKPMSASQLSHVLAPGHKSVQVIKNRFILAKQSAAATRQHFRERWQERKQQAAQTPSAPSSPNSEADAAPELATNQSAVDLPTAPRRLARLGEGFSQWRERRRQQREEVIAERIETVSPVSAAPDREQPRIRVINLERPEMKLKEESAASETPAAVATPQPPLKTDPLADKPIAIQQAGEALERGHHARVEEILVPYLVKNPKDTDAYMVLGQAALAAEQWDEAVEIFEQVLKVNARTVGAHACLGRAALRAGHLSQALQQLQRAHEENPSSEEILRQLLTLAERFDNPALQHSIQEKLSVLHVNQQETE